MPDAADRVRTGKVGADVPPALADGALLERVIANLVGNSIKHTDSPITVAVVKSGERVELRVADRGPGIPRADWDLVFRPFQRLGDRDNNAGVGLGLALARGLTMVGSLPTAEEFSAPVDSAGDEDDDEGDFANQDGGR